MAFFLSLKCFALPFRTLSGIYLDVSENYPNDGLPLLPGEGRVTFSGRW